MGSDLFLAILLIVRVAGGHGEKDERTGNSKEGDRDADGLIFVSPSFYLSLFFNTFLYADIKALRSQVGLFSAAVYKKRALNNEWLVLFYSNTHQPASVRMGHVGRVAHAARSIWYKIPLPDQPESGPIENWQPLTARFLYLRNILRGFALAKFLSARIPCRVPCA
jgi:hypothetical protein